MIRGMGRISILEGAVVALATFVVVAQAESLEEGGPVAPPAGIVKAARVEAFERAPLRLEPGPGELGAAVQVQAARVRVAPRALNPPLGPLIRIAAAAQREVAAEPEVNLFGDGLARELKGAKDATGEYGFFDDPIRPAGYQHLLVFHDGRQLSGQIVSLSDDTIVWRRPDANEPMRFSRDEVRRLVFAPSANINVLNRNLRLPDEKGDPPNKPAPATIKLPGTDWLFGEVTSKDGSVFEVKAGENSSFKIARSEVEWLYFAPFPATTAALSPNRLILESWLPNAAQADVAIDNGTVEVRGVPYITRPILNARRIEVTFEIPAEAEESLRLWLQPQSMTPNSYSGGTVNVQFGTKTISRTTVVNGLNTERISLPADLPKGSVVNYRIFHDSDDSRLFVFRNGQRLGPWSADGDARAQMFGGGSRAQPINYILFERVPSQNATLKFNSVRVQPWNGLVPDDGAASQSEDLLSFAIGASLRGKLQSIAPAEIRINGRTCPRDAGTFLELQPTKGGLDDAAALLSFGVNGEVGAVALEIREGRVRCRTSFAPAFEMPVSALQTIVFSRRASKPQEVSDRLIFKNGNELVGTLLAAGTGQRLRWRMPSGQEIEYEWHRVAGVRRPVKNPPADSPETAVFEFRNGDCLSGQFIALDERHVRLTHDRLGELTLDRDQLWNLYPRRDFAPVGAAAHPEAWLEVNPANSARPASTTKGQPALDDWIYLDGKFIPRSDTANNGALRAKVIEAPPLPETLKRYELRFDCTCARSGLPVGTVHLAAQDGNAWIRANLYGGQLRFYHQTRSNAGGNMNVRQVPLAENTELRSTRASFRMFVDTERGTAALSLNGSKLMTTGERGKERVRGVGEKVQFYIGGNGLPHVLSNVRIAPWNGEEPTAGTVGPTTVFANGDVSAGEPSAFSEGRFHLESEAGPLEVPAERIAAVRFRGEPSPARNAGRIRLHDGTVLNVESFRWDGSELTARGLNIGEFRLAASEIRELVFDPDEPGAPDTAAKE